MSDRCCTRCGQVKPGTAFYTPRLNRSRGKMTQETRCRDCYRALIAARYQDLRDYSDRYKVEAGCADCGYNQHPEALEFDHRPDEDKVADISDLVVRANWPAFLAEIAKCDVVCANCHRVRTHGRRDASRNRNWDQRRAGVVAIAEVGARQLAFDETVPVVLVAPTGT